MLDLRRRAPRRLLRGPLVRLPRSYFRHVRSPVGKPLLWRLAQHTWWLETDEIARTAFGATMHVNARDIVGRYISYFGTWEPNLTAWLQATLRSGDVFVDVGANVGYFTLLASRLVGPTGTVVAIEAVPSTAALLRENVARNGADNVRVVDAAAWHEHSTLDLYFDPEQTTGTATAFQEWAEQWNVSGGHVQVPAAPLDDLLTPDEKQRMRAIKIDIEGAELSAIRGLPEQLPPNLELVVEIAPDLLRAAGGSWEELRDLLLQRRYTPRTLENDYSPAAYWTHNGSPRFLDAPPPGADQFDVIFSR